jgi:signal transduction histidine kinase
MWIWRRTTWLRNHPRVTDAIFGTFIVVISLISQLTERSATLHRPSVWGVVLTLGATAPIVWRRRSPVPVLLVVLAFQGASEGFHYAGAGWSGVLIALYTVGTQRSGAVLRRMATVLLPLLMAFITWGVVRGDAPWEAIISTPVMFLGALILGDNMRRRRERVDELAERADRAERERELLAHQHVQEERTRIARELHDVVAHSVSLMVIQAGAARRQLSVDPTQAEAALATVEATGRSAMDEMRRILGVLRDGQGEPSLLPQPALADLDSLAATASDLPLQLSAEGNLHGLPPGVELSAYRIVQEALTNVRRHAGPVRRVDVNVHRDEMQLVVEVDDDGRGASVAPNHDGFGILGMRERVHAFGGELMAGPRHGGGWRVRAVFPVRSA